MAGRQRPKKTTQQTIKTTTKDKHNNPQDSSSGVEGEQIKNLLKYKTFSFFYTKFFTLYQIYYFLLTLKNNNLLFCCGKSIVKQGSGFCAII
jgi:hypothetical protein